jgi:hypothetical protein
MLEFGGTIYYLDLSAFDKTVEPFGNKPTDTLITNETKVTKDANGLITGIEELTHSHARGKELDPARFDIIKTMIDVVLDFEDDGDSSLGVDRALESAPLSFKLAFNTLYNYGILKEK